jgi:hypothetical protein
VRHAGENRVAGALGIEAVVGEDIVNDMIFNRIFWD